MERWTKRTADGVLLSEDHEEKYTPIELIDILLERLAAYEDTGLTPEEIRKVQEDLAPIPFGRFREIVEAERAGRLAVLPCKVGQTVYYIQTTKHGFRYVTSCKFMVCNLYWFEQGFGKTIFLTEAEAEAALKGLQEVTDDE